MSKQEGNQSLTIQLLLKDRLLPLEHANIPGQGGGQALGFFVRLLLIFERAPSKVEGRAESSNLHHIFPGLSNRSLELVLSLIDVLIGFTFLDLAALHLLLQPWHFSIKTLDLPLVTEE